MLTAMKKMMAAISAPVITMKKKTKTIVMLTMATTTIGMTAIPILMTRKIFNMKNKYLRTFYERYYF